MAAVIEAVVDLEMVTDRESAWIVAGRECVTPRTLRITTACAAPDDAAAEAGAAGRPTAARAATTANKPFFLIESLTSSWLGISASLVAGKVSLL
jgi:hypothetical protein